MYQGGEWMEHITSKESRTLKLAQSLQKKKYRTLHQAYLAEGLRTVSDMLPTGRVKSILVSDAASQEVQTVAHEANDAGVIVYMVSDELFHLVENTVHGQGIVAIVNKSTTSFDDFIASERVRLALATERGALFVVLDEVQDPGNLGTIIRTAVAADVKAIFLTKGSVDPYNEKTVRSTMSAITKIPIIENVSTEQIAILKKALGVTIYSTALEEATSIYKTNYALPAVLILGNEGRGISSEWMALADKKITIPMYGPIESLNLSVAAALCFYAIRERDVNEV